MTRNTISYKNYEEMKRANMAQESIKRDELEHKRAELAETVRNNLRNYGVNVEKNQIQRLANEQLNSREANKLLETIRSNLQNESIRLQELAEKTRNNKEQETIQKRANEIKEMDALLSAAKATGRDPASMLISWFTNQANLQAFGGRNVLNQLFEFKADDGSYDQLWNNQGSGANNPAIETYNGKQYKNYQQRSPVYHGSKTRAKGKETITDPRYVFSARNSKRKKEENEIPEDFSSSRGPGERISYENVNDKESKTQVPGVRSNYTRTEVENASQSTGVDRSKTNVIYSGNASKDRSNSGPGIGLAFN